MLILLAIIQNTERSVLAIISSADGPLFDLLINLMFRSKIYIDINLEIPGQFIGCIVNVTIPVDISKNI